MKNIISKMEWEIRVKKLEFQEQVIKLIFVKVHQNENQVPFINVEEVLHYYDI